MKYVTKFLYHWFMHQASVK